jgi:uncharacterized damage-inducible protein DinB
MTFGDPRKVRSYLGISVKRSISPSKCIHDSSEKAAQLRSCPISFQWPVCARNSAKIAHRLANHPEWRTQNNMRLPPSVRVAHAYGMMHRGISMKKTIFVLIAFATGVPIYAQAGSNPLSQGTKAIYVMAKNNVLKSAEEMPEENYSFKPTPDVRSFGALVAHVADAQYEFCSPVSGDGAKPPGVEKSKTSKADIIQGLKDGFAYCDKAYDAMTDAHGAEIIQFFGRQIPKLSVLDFNNAHTYEHYGNMVTYLRMKSLVPPSSQGR